MIKGIDILNTSFKILGAIAMGLQPQKEVKKPCGGCIEKKKKIIKYNNLKKGVK